MASVEKFTENAVLNQIRHIERTIKNPSNPDIDPSRLSQDYSLIPPDRGMTAYDYYKKRKSELYCYDRGDVKTLMGWIVTAPEDVPKDSEDLFFYTVSDFLNERYGEKNCVQCVVHKDESGRAHMHWLGIPVVPDKKHGGEKICANDVLNKRELRNFHPDLQAYLKAHGVSGTVMNGITKAQGGNRRVRDMKRERQLQRNVEHEERWTTDRARTTDRTVEIGSRW